jgi:small subunit ribosomal protein S3
MTHTVHPYVQRLGIIRGWKSRWFADQSSGDYQTQLRADVMLRNFLESELRNKYVSSIEIERGPQVTRVILRTSRPGFVIGRDGEGIKDLQAKLNRYIIKHNLEISGEVKLDIQEIKSAESDAGIVSQMVREQLERRMPFRRVLKSTVEKVMANRDVEGVRISISGRLNGAEMSRREEIKKGRIPLQTLRADIDYAHAEAILPYGVLGIKVWIYRGLVFDDAAHVPNSGSASRQHR